MAAQLAPLLNETARRLIVQQLKDNFNVALSVVDNQYDDGINLEPIDDTSIYISDKIQTLSLPAIYVLFGVMAFQYTDNPNYLNAENECVVVVSSEEIDAQNMVLKAERYARVLFSCLNLVDLKSDDGRLQVHCVPKRLSYTDEKIVAKLQKSEQKFRKDCFLELTLLHFEKNLTDV